MAKVGGRQPSTIGFPEEIICNLCGLEFMFWACISFSDVFFSLSLFFSLKKKSGKRPWGLQ